MHSESPVKGCLSQQNHRLPLNIVDETSLLKAVVVGTAQSCGPIPTPQEAYDPKSLQHIVARTYPLETDMVQEMDGLVHVLQKYGVTVYRPEVLENYNQIFARDIAFVLEDKLFHAHTVASRAREYEALNEIIAQIAPNKLVEPPKEVRVEGGDVMPWNDHIFMGTYTAPDYSDYITARTNKAAVEYIQDQFPHKTVKSFALRKSNTNPRENVLHLDCCFQPIGTHKAIISKSGFLVEEEYQWLVAYFGEENIFETTHEEMYQMFSNVFSISPEVIISERRFTRLNRWLREQGFVVEEIPYAEVPKQGGLFRCSTLPLVREG